MDTGLIAFLGLGVAVMVAALFIGRIFGRTLNRQMPGSDEGNSRTWWFAGSRRDKDGSPPDSH